MATTLRKTLWRDRNEALDPETDFVEIYQNLALYEFTWDITQALSFALFRTYAVPSIGRLLHETQQFEQACQKRYDDTSLLLEAPFVHGFDSEEGRTALRRVNQMHKMYDISNDDMRYVLSTFVVVPKRWLDDYGWRTLTPTELRASVNYYRTLGRHMGITDVPETYEGFEALLDGYEAEHFAYDEGGRKVADATLDLMTTFYPRGVRKPVEVFSRALMDDPLLEAFRYDAPHPTITRLSRGAMRLRARLLRHTPSNRKPTYTADLPRIKSYPGGYALADLGTFAPTGAKAAPGTDGAAGCPVPHRA
ncbi:oxygenase MpaB family protein [Nocardioides sp. YIM 152588]|uniref:oxygenase MpaB family protein n=1 Tax=Nocardioides sp. YIM 152588 TaxID=3158259 RepID=UPI0032E3879B